MGSTPYTVKITKTLVVDMIPHQQPALMGTVNVSPLGLMWDFAVEIHPDLSPKGEQLPGCDDVNIEIHPDLRPKVELSPNFDTTIYFVPDMLTELITSSIKTYYNTFLSSLK